MKYDYLEDRFINEPDMDRDFADRLKTSEDKLEVLLELLSILGYDKTVESAKDV